MKNKKKLIKEIKKALSKIPMGKFENGTTCYFGSDGNEIQQAIDLLIPIFKKYYKAKLKKELLAFNSWMNDNQYDGIIPLIETCIDDYLKSN